MSDLYNAANVLIFTVISAAMITVSCTAVRFLFNIPAQLQWYPTDSLFVLVVLGGGIVFAEQSATKIVSLTITEGGYPSSRYQRSVRTSPAAAAFVTRPS